MEQGPGNENWTNWDNSGQQPHRPVIVVGEQNPEAYKRSSNLSAISLVMGILSLVLFWVFYIAFFLAVIGLITGIVSLVQHRAGHGAAVGGVVTSGFGLLISLVIAFIFICAMAIVI